MKPELNPKSPLNATLMVTVHFGSWITIKYVGLNENRAREVYGMSREIFKTHPRKPVVKLWRQELTVKGGVPHSPELQNITGD